MNNCLNLPGELLESMLTMAWKNMGPEDYQKNFSETNWLNPRQAGPTWQKLINVFEQVSISQEPASPRESVEKLLPVLKKYGLTLAGHRIVRAS